VDEQCGMIILSDEKAEDDLTALASNDEQSRVASIQEILPKAIRRIVLEPGQRAELSMTTYHLAEQYRVGSPIALYNMQPWWIRFCQVIRRILLGTVMCAVLFVLVVVALFFYQYLIVFGGQMPDLQDRLLLSLPGFINGLLGCGACMITRDIIAQMVPASFLVCTEGLLKILPKQVDVTCWDEVRGTLQEIDLPSGIYIYVVTRIYVYVVIRWNEERGLPQEPGLGKRKSYKLYRKKRKPLVFGEVFEDMESLTNLIRQQLPKGQQ
jgi:hypothetical protein